MLGVQDQFVYMFSIGGAKDFIGVHDLQLFTLIEEVGNVLPTFEISFLTHRESVVN